MRMTVAALRQLLPAAGEKYPSHLPLLSQRALAAMQALALTDKDVIELSDHQLRIFITQLTVLAIDPNFRFYARNETFKALTTLIKELTEPTGQQNILALILKHLHATDNLNANTVDQLINHAEIIPNNERLFHSLAALQLGKLTPTLYKKMLKLCYEHETATENITFMLNTIIFSQIKQTTPPSNVSSEQSNGVSPATPSSPLIAQSFFSNTPATLATAAAVLKKLEEPPASESFGSSPPHSNSSGVSPKSGLSSP